MLIDDDQDCLDLNEAMMGMEGLFNIKTTTEQEEVIDKVESGWADAVVSDYDMPGKNGVELLEDVEEIDDELPYMLLTGREREEFSEEDLEKVTRYYQKDGKPETYEEIAHTVANKVERYRKLQAAGKVVGNHSGPVILIDNEQNVTYASEALAEVIDKEVHDVEGEDISAVSDPEADGRFSREVYDEALSQGSTTVQEIWKDGDRTYDLKVKPVPGYDETVVGTTTSTQRTV